MKDLFFAIAIIMLAMGISVAAPVFGFIVGVGAAIYFLYILVSEAGEE